MYKHNTLHNCILQNGILAAPTEITSKNQSRSFNVVTILLACLILPFSASASLINENQFVNNITCEELDRLGARLGLAHFQFPARIVNVSSSSDDGNSAENTLDGDLATRWSARGAGQYIQFDLEQGSPLSTLRVERIEIDWFRGDQRAAFFDIQTSIDGVQWVDVITNGNSDDTTIEEISRALRPVEANHIRIIGHGNSQNTWNSINEVKIYRVFDTDGFRSDLPIGAVSVSDAQTGAPGVNVIDRNLDTRWSARGVGQWIELDLCSIREISAVYIRWFKGNERTATFDIQTSIDGSNWTTVLANSKSLGEGRATPPFSERSTFNIHSARYVRIVGRGNTVNNWNSIKEIRVYPGDRNPVATSFSTPIRSVSASSHDGNTPENAIDDDITTRWSALGSGQYIQLQLAQPQQVTSIDIDWYKASERTAFFNIQVSLDGTNWTEIRSGLESDPRSGNVFLGTREEIENSGFDIRTNPFVDRYFFRPVAARYIRIIGLGNSENNWNSITRITVDSWIFLFI